MPGSMDSFRAVQVRAGAEISDEGKHNAKTPMDIDIEVLAARARDVGKSLMKSDFEKLSTQLQDLEQPPSRRFGQTTPNSVYSNASSGASRNDFEMPPGLSASHCSTPSNGESMPRTPSDLSQLTPYHPGIKALAGAGRPRTSSPLVTGLNSANDSDASSIIEEEHSPSHLSRPSEEEQKRFTNSDPSHSEAHGRHRSSSFSAVQHQIYSPDVLSFQQEPELATRARRASLPIVIDQNEALTWFQTSPGHRRDINLPVGLPAHPKRAAPTRPEDEIETIGGAEVAVEDEKVLPPSDEKIASSDSSKASVWSRAAASIEATYYPSESPPLIMPTGPTDLEKTLYLKTNRLGLYSFGVFSFLSLSVGMWLFVVSSFVFYWFGAVVFLLQLYLVISYIVSICGKDYDIKKHERILAENPIDRLTCPTIDVYLPCCKEPIEILENTYKHIQQLQWPEGKLKVWVLDDGGSEAVQTLAGSYGYSYICREDRPRLKKAGNLRWAFARTEGDFFAIFDADFCPRPDFLHEIMPIHLARPDTAIVQTPQFFRTSSDQSWVEQGAGSVQELFYRVVQINRNRFGAAICVGSNAVYRREALVEVGGTAEIGFSEDVHTGFYAVTRGWKVRYLPLCLACGICPDTPRAFFSQQMRWCMGSTTLLTNMDFWRSDLSWIQKICYLSGMMYYSAISLSIFINPLPGVLMLWIRPEYVRYYNLAFAVPSILYSIIAIRCWAKASYGFNVQFIMVIQSYAYLTAIKDRLFGRALAWVPSGDTKAHKNNKYRNMRILAWCWTITIISLVVSGTVYQCLRGLPWYDCIPLIVLDCFNLFLAHRFLLWSGKI